jgi:hypothetical protein
VVIASGFQRALPIFRLTVACHSDDDRIRATRFISKPAGKLKSVHAR